MIDERGQSILLRVRRFRILGLLAAAALLGSGGCGRENASLSTETDEPLYREGLQLKREGRTQEALAAYLKLIARRGDQAPDSHLDAGLICLEDIKDPIAAIYHFHKFLELEPNSPNSARVKGLIDTATREFARTLPGRPMDSQVGGGELLDQVDRLQRENDELKAKLAAAGAAVASRPAAPAGGEAGDAAGHAFLTQPAPEADAAPVILTPVAPDVSTAPPPPPAEVPARPAPARAASAAAGRSYTVQAHDTLYGIAKKVYGVRSREKVEAILQANRRVLPGPSALKPGMELRIP